MNYRLNQEEEDKFKKLSKKMRLQLSDVMKNTKGSISEKEYEIFLKMMNK
tara:strand:+ start:6270 stop:6419 length:150 start_codon:yes stop_codon:yes gene_type:complete